MLKNYLPPSAYQSLLREKAERLKHRALRPSVLLTLPELHPAQQAIVEHPALRKVICAGRRFGKTTLAARVAVEYLLKGKSVLLSSTSQDQADVFWRLVREWTVPLLNTGGYKNDSKRMFTYAGGSIRVKTGRHPDALRGDGVDLLVLDECAYLDADAWGQVGAPMLADNPDAVAMFISTPKRRNWFFRLYSSALQDESGVWRAWHATTKDNPHITGQAYAQLVADMTEDDFKQEILAEFLEGQGAVFRYIDERCTARRAEPYPGRFVAGLDWAQQKDYTVMVVIDADTRTVVDYDRFNGVDWALQRGRVKALAERWGVSLIIGESNSIGSPNIEALQLDGLPIVPFETTGTSKPVLIESLVLAFDKAEITCLDDALLKSELMAYERTVSSTGRSQYSAPEGLHDDMVMALALAWRGVVNRRGDAISIDWW